MPSTNISENINRIREEITEVSNTIKASPPHIIAVSKKHSVSEIAQAINAGADYIAESYVQEAIEKIHELNYQNWDFIGRIQSNKLKHIVKYFNRIHSVSKIKHILEIDKIAKLESKTPKLFIQVNIAQEKTKDGIENYEELKALIASSLKIENPCFKIIGLMTIPPYSDKPENSRKYFSNLREMMFTINKDLGTSLNKLSMGMSRDYKVATEEGATELRIGTAIFGERIY